MSGKLIVIEGLDGSGKQTQTSLLREALKDEGRKVLSVSFPDYGQPSSALVKQYLAGEFGAAGDVSPYAASAFYAVDRFASFHKFWKKSYEDGYTILADRYATSNLIYQMCKLPREDWDAFAAWMDDYEYGKLSLPKPDLVLFLDMHPGVSRSLISKRYGGDESKRDIHEADYTYIMKCRECALYCVEHFGWKAVKSSENDEVRPIRAIAGDIKEIIDQFIL